MRHGSASAVVLAFALAVTAQAQSITSAFVRNDVSGGYLNLRTGPGVGFDIVAPIPAGQQIELTGDCQPSADSRTKALWCKVVWRGRRGWVSQNGFADSVPADDAKVDGAENAASKFDAFEEYRHPEKDFSPPKFEYSTIANEQIYMRAGPGIAFDIIAKIPNSTPLEKPDNCRTEDIDDVRLSWCEQTWQGKAGWVERGFIASKDVTPKRPARTRPIPSLAECTSLPKGSDAYYYCFDLVVDAERKRQCGDALFDNSASDCRWAVSKKLNSIMCPNEPRGGACSDGASSFSTRRYNAMTAYLDKLNQLRKESSGVTASEEARDAEIKAKSHAEYQEFKRHTPGTELEVTRKWLDRFRDQFNKARQVQYAIANLPPWNGDRPPMPEAKTQSELSAMEIYKTVSSSVYLVQAGSSLDEIRAGTLSLGSAVAISPHEALTNCHVINGKTTIQVVVPSSETVIAAKVQRSDPAQDKCILEVTASLNAISGVRDVKNVEIGEKVYSLGNPKGLSLTIADGIVSGIREMKGTQLVQTTAPISPGSSGGALVDRFGNLVGITTFLLKESQNLNFAIAASEYWKTRTAVTDQAETGAHKR